EVQRHADKAIGIQERQDQLAGTSRALAIAAMPSPRPVRPSPSVVVPDTLTGAPDSASLRTFSASARRDASRGRFPTTWTATLPTTNPAPVTSRNVSHRRASP